MIRLVRSSKSGHTDRNFLLSSATVSTVMQYNTIHKTCNLYLFTPPYEKFADMIERHWDGIAAYCRPENKVSLGFVEGLNNKIRVIQRRAYGLRDEEYLRLKILTCMLPEI